MNLYHASFKGRRTDEHFQPLRKIAVVVAADSIYDVRRRVELNYEFITGLCVTNCEATGIELFEVSSK